MLYYFLKKSRHRSQKVQIAWERFTQKRCHDFDFSVLFISFTVFPKTYSLEGAFTYFDDFQGCWIKSFALLHNFALDRFVNLIPDKGEAHNIVLNLYGDKNRNVITIKQARVTTESNDKQIQYNLLCIVPFSLRREIFLLAIPLAHSMATSSRYSIVLSSGLFSPGPLIQTEIISSSDWTTYTQILTKLHRLQQIIILQITHMFTIF